MSALGTSDDRPITVIVADDDPDMVLYLRAALGVEGFSVVGAAGDTRAAVELAASTHAEVALLDLNMPGGGGLEAARRIREVSPSTHVVVLSARSIDLSIVPLLSAGIDAYLVKGTSGREIARAIRNAVDGGAYLAPAAGRIALDQLATRLHAEEDQRELETEATARVLTVVEAEQFHMVFQPIVELDTLTARGAEALTRFHGHDDRSPHVWFEEAAAVGHRATLELATAGSALRSLDLLSPELAMTINISPATALSGRLAEILAEVDLPRVIIEVTEHSPVTDYAALNASLEPWRARGVRLAVDDAGGGYASFSHILNLAPDFIKLDIELIRQIDTDVRRQALARAICGFADELGVTVVAEGIETAAELEAVVAVGAALGQGFHLGRPRRLEAQPRLTACRDEVHLRLVGPARLGARRLAPRLSASR